MDLPFLLRPKSTDSGHCNLVTGFPFPIEFGKKEISETFQPKIKSIVPASNNDSETLVLSTMPAAS
eukprot:gene2325-8052_t